MVRVWVKLIKEEKVYKDLIDFLDNESEDSFFDSLSKFCEKLDVGTPVILTKHIKSFMLFNICEFLPSEFVEPFDYDKLIIENATE